MPRNKKNKQKEEDRLKGTLRSLTETDEHETVNDNTDPNVERGEIRKTGRATDRLDIEPKHSTTGSDDDGQAR